MQQERDLPKGSGKDAEDHGKDAEDHGNDTGGPREGYRRAAERICRRAAERSAGGQQNDLPEGSRAKWLRVSTGGTSPFGSRATCFEKVTRGRGSRRQLERTVRDRSARRKRPVLV